MAFNLTLRSDERSLTAEEADADVQSILDLRWSGTAAPCCAEKTESALSPEAPGICGFFIA